MAQNRLNATQIDALPHIDLDLPPIKGAEGAGVRHARRVVVAMSGGVD